MSNMPIADYALLSDCRSAALVSRLAPLTGCAFPASMGRRSLPGCWMSRQDTGPSTRLVRPR